MDSTTSNSTISYSRKVSCDRIGRFRCSICSRPFDRRDVLSRHMIVHDECRKPLKPRRKACVPCFKSKIRCFAERPSCSSCAKRNLPCVYEKNSAARPSRVSTTVSRTTEQHANSIQLPVNETPKGNLSHSRLLPLATGEVEADSGILGSFLDTSGDLSGAQSQIEGLDPGADVAHLCNDDFLGAFNGNFDGTDFNSNLGWIFEPSMYSNFSNYSEPSVTLNPMDLPGNPIPRPRASQIEHLNDDQLPNGERNLEKDASIAALSISHLQEGCSPDDPWPMEWHATAPSAVHNIVLPSLGDDMQDSNSCLRYFPTTSVTFATHLALQEYLQIPSKRSPWQPISLPNFPSKERLDYCIDMYFAHFHPVYAPRQPRIELKLTSALQVFSIIHKSTFDPAKDLIVTLAMVSIGACYTEFPQAQCFASGLSELCRRLLVFMAEYDRRFVRTEAYLTAQLLQGIHGYCSGNERLFELSESCRSLLVHHAKCMGLFRYNDFQTHQEDASIDDQWNEWIGKEQLRRLGWAVYEYDSSVAYLHNSRPYLSVVDINLGMPCSSDLWEAESAYSWATLRPWTNTHPATVQLSPLMKILLNGTSQLLDQIRDEKHRLLIIVTLVRSLWTVKDMKSSPIFYVAGTSFESGKRRILQVIDRFIQSPTKISKELTRVEMTRLVYRVRLAHIAHLYGAGDLMNWLYPFLRKDVAAENARLRMFQWATEDPMRAREVTYHSAQILALVRQYPNNDPNEAFIVFHAGVVLSLMARLLPVSRSFHNGPMIRIDHLGPADDPVASSQRTWVRDGGDAIINLHGVPSLCSSLGRTQVLDQTAELLKRRDVWGIARNFTKIVLIQRDEDFERMDKGDAARGMQ